MREHLRKRILLRMVGGGLVLAWFLSFIYFCNCRCQVDASKKWHMCCGRCWQTLTGKLPFEFASCAYCKSGVLREHERRLALACVCAVLKCVCVCVCAQVCMCVYVCAQCSSVCARKCVCLCLCVRACVYMRVCMCGCMCMCVFVSMYVRACARAACAAHTCVRASANLLPEMQQGVHLLPT